MNRVFWVFAAIAASALIGCSDDTTGAGAGSGTGGVGGGAIKSCDTLNAAPDGCGEPCTGGADCLSGTYCDPDLRVCSAQCVVRDDCKAGYICNARGICSARCEPEDDCGPGYECNANGICATEGGGTGGSMGTGATGGNECQSVSVTPTRSIPNVMFLVDQSGSMTSGFAGGEDRWEAAHSAINSIVSDLDSIVRFGLTSYTSRDGDHAGQECPRLPIVGDPDASSARVDFGLNNASDFSDTNVYPYSYPDDAGEDTPTGDSIDALVSLIQADPPPADGPTIIVLATDGEPDSCECPDGGHPGCNGATPPRDEAVTASAAAHAAGYDVFVLWVGQLSSSSTRNHLQEVANAGVAGTGTVWVGDNPANLSNAFQTIIGDSISCEIEIDKAFDDEVKACDQGDVRLNENSLDCPSDWRVKSDKVIELVGSACTEFKSGSSTFTAEFPCGAIVVE